jgi:uncharacterized membrane protein YqjE
MAEWPKSGGERAPTLLELVRDLGQNVAGLVRDEIDLAKKELRAEFVRSFRAGVVGLALAALLGAASILTLCAALVLGLAHVIDPAWAALVVGVGLGLGAAISAAVARKRLRPSELKPLATVETLKEDKAWLKKLGGRR